MSGKYWILLCGGEAHQGQTQSCYVVEMSRQGKLESCYNVGKSRLPGVDMAASLDGHRMSVGSRRHCIWEYTGYQLRVCLTASLDGHRMSV